jgi:hypothetical protein
LASTILVTPYCQEKSISIKRRSEFCIPLKKQIRIDFTIVESETLFLNSAF